MRVVITGASGFLGGYLVKELLRVGAEPLLLSRRSGQVYGCPLLQSDYSAASLAELFKDADAIVHLASTRGVYEHLSAYYDCIDLTENVYQAAVQSGVTNIVYASSISVYSGLELPYFETLAPAPGSLYGIHKLACESLGNFFSSRNGLKIKNLRLAHLYGANENNNYMINLFFRQAFSHQQLHVFSKNSARRQMLYAKDAALAILNALDKHDLSGTFNIGSNDVLTNSEIAETICRVFSPELNVLYGDKIEHMPSSYMDSTKARKLLQYRPRYSFEEAVKEIYEDMSKVVRSGLDV